VIRKTVERGGSVVVPAFAVERTQKFVFMLKELMESGQAPRVPVYCDSPMAIKAVEIFLKHTEEYSDATKQLISRYGSPLKWQGFSFAQTSEESKKINDSNVPCIIISSSGMVTGGRIQHHLIQRLPDPKNTVIFIGFQAPGTRGFTIKSGAPEVRMFGQMVPIRAQVAALEQFSDHADTPELLEWLHSFTGKPKMTYLVHGEPAAASQLRDTMSKELGWNVQIAQWMQKVEVKYELGILSFGLRAPNSDPSSERRPRSSGLAFRTCTFSRSSPASLSLRGFCWMRLRPLSCRGE